MKETVNADASQLLSGRLLARNSLWNLTGLGLPLVAAVVTIPTLVRLLGTDRFGLLAIGWALIGYFGLFDLGLGRALTMLVAERIAKGDREDLPALIGTGLVLLTALGVLACALLLVAIDVLVDRVLAVSPTLRSEALQSFELLALALPIVMLSTALVGVLEGQQRFKAINLVRIPAGVLTYLGPFVAVLIEPSLVAAVFSLLVVRLASAIAYGWSTRDTLPRRQSLFRRSFVRPLLSFGGWVTVSNVIGPLMVYFDRFVIGALLSLSAVAYYATPYEAVTRAWVLPTAVSAVAFPAMTMASRVDPERLDRLYRRTVDAILLAMTVPLALLVLFAPEGLTTWLGPAWAAESTSVLRWLAPGVLINSIARVPFALIQGVGRPDVTAKLHLAELPIYAVVVVVLLSNLGVSGAAAAWTLRIAIDALALSWLGARLVPAISGAIKRATLATAAATLVLAAGIWPQAPGSKAAYAGFLVVLGVMAAAAAARLMPGVWGGGAWRRYVG